MSAVNPQRIQDLQNLIPTTGECFDIAAYLSLHQQIIAEQNACIAGFQAQLDQLRDDLTVCCGTTGGAEPTFQDCLVGQTNDFTVAGNIGVYNTLSEFSEPDIDTCVSTVTASYNVCIFSGGSPNTQPVSGDVSFTVDLRCDGAVVASAPVVRTYNFDGNPQGECFTGDISLTHASNAACNYALSFSTPVITGDNDLPSLTQAQASNFCIEGICS